MYKHLIYLIPLWRLWAKNAYAVINVEDMAVSESGEASADRWMHMRHHLHLSKVWYSGDFMQAEKDDFTRLSFRGLAGGGMCWRSVYTPNQAVYLRLGGMFKREWLKPQSTTTDNPTTSKVRGNACPVFRHHLNKQADITNATGFRLLEDASLNVKKTSETFPGSPAW